MITVDNLAFAYPGQKRFLGREQQPVFTGTDFTLGRGHICGLLGPNGSGKTTLLKLMAGLLFPQAGDIRISDYIPAQRSPAFLCDIVYLPEEFHVPALSPDQYAWRQGVFYPRFDASLFSRLLGGFNIPGDRSMTALSHGQRKKAMMSFALATRASLILLDEPSNGMDIPGKSQFREALLSGFDEQSTVIISTHQVHDLDGLIDTVSILTEGRVLLTETLERINEQLVFEQGSSAPESALFSEQSIGGRCAWVSRNDDSTHSHVDLSLLFGLVTHHPQLVRELFPEEA